MSAFKAGANINILDTAVKRVDTVNNLGVCFDSEFTSQDMFKPSANFNLKSSQPLQLVDQGSICLALPGSLQIASNIHTWLQRNKKQETARNYTQSHAMFKMALLVYTFLHRGTPAYFTPFLKPRALAYKTCSYTANSIILDILQYIRSFHKSIEHFSARLNFGPPTIWNLLTNIHCTPSLISFRSKLQAYIFVKAYPY